MLIKIEREACGYGWVCFDDDSYDGPGSALGHGKTEDEAYREFLMQLWDRSDLYRTEKLVRLMRAEFGDEDGWEELDEEPDPDALREIRDENQMTLRLEDK